MIALSPQFVSLLVALTATAVQSAPHTGHHHHHHHHHNHHHHHHHGRRLVLNAQVSPVEIQLARRVGGRLSVRDGADHIYVAPPRAHNARRGFDDPIDEPDQDGQETTEPRPRPVEGPEVSVPDQAEGDHAEDSPPQKRRYFVHDMDGPGLIISHPQMPSYPHLHYSRSLAVYDLHRRGLLDAVIPVLGSLPGVGGVVKIITDTLENVLNGLPILGPILGGLLLSPHSSAAAQGLNDTTVPPEYYLDASSTRNASTIYLVDSGRPSPFAMAVQNAGNSSTERLVSLQMAFVNAETGHIEAYCATFKHSEGDHNEPAALAALPCIMDGVTDSPHPSQLWGYNPANQAIRPMWDDVDNSGKSKARRAYVVQSAGGDNATLSEGQDDMDRVVLVFKPFEVDNQPNVTYGGATYDPKDAGRWQMPEGNSTGEADPDPVDAQTNDASEEASYDSVPVFIAGAGHSS